MNKVVATIFVVLICIALIFCLTGCNVGYNKQVVDLNYNFSHAIIFLPNGEKIEGKVQSWNDYDQSDMMQVKIDGTVYLTHSSNVILMSK